MRFIRVFSELTGELRYSTQKRILTEVALIKLCRPEMEAGTDALAERIARLESKIEKGISVPLGAAAAPVSAASSPAAAPVKKAPLPKAVPEDIKKVVREWSTITGMLDVIPPVRSYYQKAHLSIGGEGESQKLLLVLDDYNAVGLCGEEENLKALSEAVRSHIGKEVAIELRENKTGRAKDEGYHDLKELLEQNVKMEIEIED